MMLLSAGNGFAVDNSIHFDIPSQEIESALDIFVKQTQISVSYGAKDLHPVITSAVYGRYSPYEALSIMLKETQLTYEKVSDEIISRNSKAVTSLLIRVTLHFRNTLKNGGPKCPRASAKIKFGIIQVL